MKYLFLVFLSLWALQSSGQTYEAGLYGGGLNAIGDVGQTTYISPSGPAVGGIFKWNKSKRYAWRASLIYGSFELDDDRSSLANRKQRGYVMDNTILEASAGLEVNFVEYNLHRLGPAFTPYLYTGLTYFRYGFNYFDAGQFMELDQREGSLAIPMTLGVKSRLNRYLLLGAEIGARYTFTDNLDGSNPEGSNLEPFRFGNIFSDDWYVFSGITLTYTWGRDPCRDCFE